MAPATLHGTGNSAKPPWAAVLSSKTRKSPATKQRPSRPQATACGWKRGLGQATASSSQAMAAVGAASSAMGAERLASRRGKFVGGLPSSPVPLAAWYVAQPRLMNHAMITTVLPRRGSQCWRERVALPLARLLAVLWLLPPASQLPRSREPLTVADCPFWEAASANEPTLPSFFAPVSSWVWTSEASLLMLRNPMRPMQFQIRWHEKQRGMQTASTHLGSLCRMATAQAMGPPTLRRNPTTARHKEPFMYTRAKMASTATARNCTIHEAHLSPP
mmetsp:Transcript_92680/g.288359  ORF Transcript_92680/g.288359 Transcript_92680/m.288359 type:complete len:275 (+) Transcript_92680:502-1326(+)